MNIKAKRQRGNRESQPPPDMLRRCGSALLGGVHRASGARQATGTARDVVAAVSELRLPEKLAGREKVGSAAAAASELPLDRVPVQLAPYQALPVDGRITRHFTRGLPVVDPASRTPEVRGWLAPIEVATAAQLRPLLVPRLAARDTAAVTCQRGRLWRGHTRAASRPGGWVACRRRLDTSISSPPRPLPRVGTDAV
jgi:hypothetical protein